MSRKFYLKDKEGYIKSEINIKSADKNMISGDCIDYYSWSSKEPGDYHYFAGFVIKWDACSHWYFSGEDYPDDKDSYYHICGEFGCKDFIDSYCFIWKVAYMLLESREFDLPEHIDEILKGYTIEESE